MLLGIDIGNTNIVAGVMKPDKPESVADWRITTRLDKTADEWGVLYEDLLKNRGVDKTAVDAAIISSVVPALNRPFADMLQKYFSLMPLFADHTVKLNMKICYDHPEEVGADRIVNAAGAIEEYTTDLIIIDFGTATTFDVITKSRDYLGGCIIPGLELMRSSLHRRTARLPEVDIAQPPSVIGRNTVSSIQAGLYYGAVGQLEYIIERIFQETGTKEYTVIATGGLAPIIARSTKLITRIDSALTLKGLHVIYKLNS